MSAAAERLLIVLVNTDPRNGEELGAPFYHAAVAAALGYQVDVVCTATAGRLLKRGVAEALEVKPGSGHSVYRFIQDAHRHGARFWAWPRPFPCPCPPSRTRPRRSATSTRR